MPSGIQNVIIFSWQQDQGFLKIPLKSADQVSGYFAIDQELQDFLSRLMIVEKAERLQRFQNPHLGVSVRPGR